MPELPEVEAAAGIARRTLVGRRLVAVSTHHPSQRRTLPARDAARLVGRRVTAVERRGKHQHVHLDDGAVLAVHFRMTGDWDATRASAAMPRFARITFDTDDGQRLSLVDSRALCSATYHPPGDPPRLQLGPEPDELTVGLLRAATERRAGPIKPVLLDQRAVAGLGNIYAAEALWRARIHPGQVARNLSGAQLRALVRGIKAAIADGFARQVRYRDGSSAQPFRVYDREDRPCQRCRTPIARITQAGRSTYYCPRCQRTA